MIYALDSIIQYSCNQKHKYETKCQKCKMCEIDEIDTAMTASQKGCHLENDSNNKKCSRKWRKRKMFRFAQYNKPLVLNETIFQN